MNSHEYTIEVYGLRGGALEMIVQRDGAMRTPTESELETGWENAERFLSRLEPGVGGLRAELPVPALVSEATRIDFDSTGSLWVRGSESPGTDRVPYEIFGADGIWLGQVSLPARLRILEIGGDYILGVEQDDLDVERVVMYDLEREPLRGIAEQAATSGSDVDMGVRPLRAVRASRAGPS